MCSSPSRNGCWRCSVEAIVSLAIIATCVWALSVITDEFFIISLDQISEKLNLPPSVAGASLMAMGSSAPELAIAILALFGGGGEHSDVGIGTIVGSAVFNILIIVGVSAAVRPAQITMSAIARDCIFYCLAVGLLLGVFHDGRIELWECGAFLGLYVVYLLVLLRWKDKPRTDQNLADEDVAEKIAESTHEMLEAKSLGVFGRVTHLMTSVLRVAMRDPAKHYLWAFVLSIVLIGLLCYVLVESALVFAAAVNIPPVVVALTILAGGTSVPDMISSVVVARQGRGDMAVANAVGSNIFDILICLGLPWLISIAIMGKEVHVGAEGLTTSVLILLGTVVLLFVFAFSSRTVSRVEGFILIAVYVGYAAYVWLSPQPTADAPTPATDVAVPHQTPPPDSPPPPSRPPVDDVVAPVAPAEPGQ